MQAALSCHCQFSSSGEGRNVEDAVGGALGEVAAHGGPYVQDILRAKGWFPRTPDLLSDLKAGRELAALAAA